MHAVFPGITAMHRPANGTSKVLCTFPQRLMWLAPLLVLLASVRVEGLEDVSGFLKGWKQGRQGNGTYRGVRIPSVGNVPPRPPVVRKRRRHGMAITAIFKWELPYLEEWIEYHRLIGVNHFFMYDNECVNRTGSSPILRPYVRRGWVTHIDWCRRTENQGPQILAYGDAFRRYGRMTVWMAFIDVDEYLVPLTAIPDSSPVSTSLLYDILKSYDRRPIGGVYVNWYLFGPHGHRQPPNGSTITQYRSRASADNYWSGFGKSIVRPQRVRNFTQSVHKPFYWHRYTGVTTSKTPIPNTYRVGGQRLIAAEHTILVLNHYRTRSVQDYMWKLRRGRPHTPTSFRREFLELNDEVDMRIIYKTRQLLDQLERFDAEEAGRVEAIVLDWGRGHV